MVTLSHIHIVYLPKNTTSAVQLADQGIIRCLKADYKRNLVEFQWQAFLEMRRKAEAVKKEHLAAIADAVPTCEPPPFKADLSKVKPSLHTAVTWCIEGWRSMPSSVIANCWRHSGILPQHLRTHPLRQLQVSHQMQVKVQAGNQFLPCSC